MQKHQLDNIVKSKFLINLKRRPDRLKYALEQFEKIGISDVKLIPAVDANELGLKSNIERIKPGMVGCFESHKLIMKACLDNGIESYVVFEDDPKFIDGFNQLLEMALQQLPSDWEFVYLGCTEHEGFGTHLKQVNDFWVIPNNAWGTQCFMMRGTKTIEKIYKALEVQEMQIDEQLTHMVLRTLGIKHYAVFPSMVNQLFELDSDVQDRKLQHIKT